MQVWSVVVSNFLNNKFFSAIRSYKLHLCLGLVVMAGPVNAGVYDKTDLWRAGVNQLGPVQIGINREELGLLVGELEQQKGDGEGCVYFSPLNGEKDVSFMLFEGRLVRIDVYSRRTETLSGLRVGDSAERIKQIYADNVKIMDQEDNPSGELLYLTSGKPEFRNYRLVFEVNHGIVTDYRLGLLPYVNWKGGCAGER